MSTAPDISILTEDEYLQGELLSDIRHEYINGEIYAMVGATGEHHTIGLTLPIATIYERVETPDLLAWREQHNR